MPHARRPLFALAIALMLPAAAVAQVRAGAQRVVNTYVTGIQAEQRVAVGSDGRFVVTWTQRSLSGDDDVRAQRFDAAGAPVGGEMAVNTYTTGGQRAPDVGIDKSGNFVVVWGGTPSRPDLFGQRFDAAGNPLGTEFQVSTGTLSGFTSGRLAMGATGSFVVAWPSALGISARRFGKDGTGIGAEFQVNTSTPLTMGSPAISGTGDDFVVAWEVERVPFDKDVVARRVAGGAPVGTELAVNAYTTGRQTRPSVARTVDGSFVVTWAGADGSQNGIRGQRFDAAGSPAGIEFAVNSYTTDNQYSPSVAMDAVGNFVVSWSSTNQDGDTDAVVAQRFDAQGARRGIELVVNTYTTSYQNNPVVGSDPVGNFTVTWMSYAEDGNDWGVVEQRFGGLRPTSLAVDTLGNNILEPGETAVLMVPTWRNENGLPQAFTGVLGRFGGPAPAIYAIDDANADYGTVANGASASCGTNCYRLSVSVPPTRPLHWDATALESILPDVQGQQKNWVLHVGKSFSDVPTTSPFIRFIETVLHNNLTTGCGGGRFCPGDPITRAQMAVFALLAKFGTDYLPPACAGTPMFADVPITSPFCRWVEDFARSGITGGCGNGNFCPNNPVTREQMAVFIVRLREPNVTPPPCVPPNLFLDVPETSPFCRWIEYLAGSGGTGGCGGGNYCPTQPVTREQMAVFLVVVFQLALYGV